MSVAEIKNDRLDDKYYRIEHSSGLTVYVYPKKDYVSTYAAFASRFGSIDTEFIYDGEKIAVPDGIAHYLEHKLFECEEGDAIAKFSKIGAFANAYTAFDKTCYLFSCTQKFEEALEILLDFVQKPYFTAETVQKEQGIIAQEIKMYDDNPELRVMLNLLDAMYHNNPVKKDIVGTVESIADITAEKLYTCYNGFYNPKNMVLCVTGNADVETVLRIVDKTLKPNDKPVAVPVFEKEPYSVRSPYVENEFSISMPMFQLGFKEDVTDRVLSENELAQTDVLMFLLSSNMSPLYKELTDEKLINITFGYEHFEGRGYSAVLFSGESRAPKLVAEKIRNAVITMKNRAIDENYLKTAKKAIYGSVMASFNSVDAIANTITDFALSGRDVYRYLDAVMSITADDIKNRLADQIDENNFSLSVAMPKTERIDVDVPC